MYVSQFILCKKCAMWLQYLFHPPKIYVVNSIVNYTLKNPHGILGRISLFKSSYKLGEDITGAMDLTTGTVACLQVIYSYS